MSRIVDWEVTPNASDPDLWSAQVGRFTLVTWPFGSIFQAKVHVEYKNSKNTFSRYPYVGIRLAPGKTRSEAQERCVDWMRRYEREGAPDPEQVLDAARADYPELYPDRATVLDHIFLTGGNSYAWLDGAVYDTDQEPVLPRPSYDVDHWAKDVNDLLDQAHQLLKEAGLELAPEPEPPEPEPPPTYSLGNFTYTTIQTIPVDAKPEWLHLALEAAQLLIDHPTEPEDAAVGHRIAKDIQKRLYSLT